MTERLPPRSMLFNGRGNRVGASLLIGWFASALGWKLQKAAAGGGGVVAAHFSADGWRPVEVAFRSVPKEQMAEGEVSAIRIAGSAKGKTFNLTVMRDPERARRPSSPGFFTVPAVYQQALKLFL